MAPKFHALRQTTLAERMAYMFTQTHSAMASQKEAFTLRILTPTASTVYLMHLQFSKVSEKC